MVYAPQRRHAVASFATTIHTLGVLQHLYSPNILILLSRVLAQVQIAVTSSMHPTRSLMSLFFMVTFMNAVAMFLHFLDFVSGMNGGKGIILDFIGQSRPASLFRMIVLDILIYYLQVSSLTVSYITMRSAPLPETPSLPFKDVLLPPSSSIPYEYIESDEKDLDLESGQSVRKRSKGKGKASDGDDVNEFWLDDEDDEDRGASTTSRLLANSSIPLSSRSTRQEPPLIFSLSLSHILNLVFYLPAPPPPPRVFSGGTPSVSPRINPMNELPPTTPPMATRPPVIPTPATPAARGDSAAEDADETETSPQTGRRGRGAVGLMPGDYWVAGRDRGESG